MTPGNPVVGSTVLRRPAVQSPNYAAGSAGWIIKTDGSAEFNNLVIRGTFDGTDFIINSSGAFFYSGTPAAGNLIASIASASGTDGFGNAYQQGITSYQGGTAGYIKMLAGLLNFSNGAGISTGVSGGSTTADTLAFGSGGGLASLFLDAQSWISVPLAASDPSQLTTTRETWHSLGTLAGYSITIARYRLTPMNEVELDINVTAGGTNAASVAFSVTLPAGYQPVRSYRRVLGLSAGSLGSVEPNVFISTAGAVTIGQNSNNTVNLYGRAVFPLD
jgi:hypothetical protein